MLCQPDDMMMFWLLYCKAPYFCNHLEYGYTLAETCSWFYLGKELLCLDWKYRAFSYSVNTQRIRESHLFTARFLFCLSSGRWWVQVLCRRRVTLTEGCREFSIIYCIALSLLTAIGLSRGGSSPRLVQTKTKIHKTTITTKNDKT